MNGKEKRVRQTSEREKECATHEDEKTNSKSTIEANTLQTFCNGRTKIVILQHNISPAHKQRRNAKQKTAPNTDIYTYIEIIQFSTCIEYIV